MRYKKLPALLSVFFVTACVGLPAKSVICPIKPVYTDADIEMASDGLIRFLSTVEDLGAKQGCWPELD